MEEDENSIISSSHLPSKTNHTSSQPTVDPEKTLSASTTLVPTPSTGNEESSESYISESLAQAILKAELSLSLRSSETEGEEEMSNLNNCTNHTKKSTQSPRLSDRSSISITLPGKNIATSSRNSTSRSCELGQLHLNSAQAELRNLPIGQLVDQGTNNSVITYRKRNRCSSSDSQTRNLKPRAESLETTMTQKEDHAVPSRSRLNSTNQYATKSRSESLPGRFNSTRQDFHPTTAVFHPTQNTVDEASLAKGNNDSMIFQSYKSKFNNEGELDNEIIQRFLPPFGFSAESTTNATSFTPIDQMSMWNHPNLAGTKIPNLEILVRTHEDQGLETPSQLHQKRSLSPTNESNTRIIRPRLEISPPASAIKTKQQLLEDHSLSATCATPTGEPPTSVTIPPAAASDLDGIPIFIAHTSTQPIDREDEQIPLHSSCKETLSSGQKEEYLRSPARAPEASNENEQPVREKKPLYASTALPVYSKLIVALEEAKRSNCLTTPMITELENLTSRCKKTGKAIIQNCALPPEDEVIVIPDDDEGDLIRNYGVQLDLFVSEADDLEITEQAGLDTCKTDKEHTSPDNRNGLKQKCKEIQQTDCIIEQTPSIDMVHGHTTPNEPALPPPNHEESAVLGQSPDFQPGIQNPTPSVGSFDQSEHTPEKSYSTPEVAESYNPENLLEKSQSQSSASVDQFINSANSIEKSHSNPERSSDKSQSRSNVDQSLDSVNTIDSSQPDSVANQSKKAETSPRESQSTLNPRVLRSRKKTQIAVVIPKYTPSKPKSKSSTTSEGKTKTRGSRATNSKTKENLAEAEVIEEIGGNITENEEADQASPLAGSYHQEEELVTLLSPYTSNQTSKVAKLAAWKALNALLERRRQGEPLDQTFLDSIDDGTDNVVVKTKFNAQTWFEAIEITMPDLFNSHAGEPAYALGFFNTLILKNESLSEKIPQGLPHIWYHTWRSMRMCIRPSPARVSSFLKVLLDSVLLTGKSFLKESPATEEERAMTGIEAVCQAIKWLNSQKTTKINNANTVRLIDSNNVTSAVDIGLILQWQQVFVKVIDSYMVQYFEAKYILNEEASAEDKAVAIRFKREWKGDSIKSPSLSYLTMFACCGIRGLICCSGDVNIAPAGQMLGFTVLSEWMSKQRPGFKVKEPIFKRSNQMLMRLIDGLFDKDGHFVKPEITWYDLAKNLCFDYLSYWFLEAGDLAEGGSLVFPKSTSFAGKAQTIKF